MKIIFKMTRTDFEELFTKLGVSIRDESILSRSLIHRSYLNENKDPSLQSNEKLEFLGDSVLSLITTHYLYENYPLLNEGNYTDIKATIVRTESLAIASKNMGLGKFVVLSKGEEENGGRENTSILADLFEAILGAIYLSEGFEMSRKFVHEKLFNTKLDEIIKSNSYVSAKNRLQEYYQEKYRKLPRYTILAESGPQHEREYRVGVWDDEVMLAEGVGKSKKTAEEVAAEAALAKIRQ